MKKFLRYHGKHHLWFPRGYKGWRMPRLNPLESCSHAPGNKRTWSLWEPTWFYFLRKEFFNDGGEAVCNGMKTRWRIGQDGNRACDMCGSMHPDDVLRIAHLSLTDTRYSIDGTDKNYKVYIRQPDVVNAGQGAIKFYMYHLPPKGKQADEFLVMLNKAAKTSHDRWAKQYEEKKNG